jgi:hypothetical protein
MRAFSLRIGEVISLPEQDLSIEVLDVQDDHVSLRITGPFSVLDVQDDHVSLRITGPFSVELEGEDDLNFQEQVVFLESAG